VASPQSVDHGLLLPLGMTGSYDRDGGRARIHKAGRFAQYALGRHEHDRCALHSDEPGAIDLLETELGVAAEAQFMGTAWAPIATSALCALFLGEFSWGETRTSNEDELSQIVVTAQKREEPTQTIPMSIVAISAAAIDVAGSVGFHDLLLSVPGLSYSGSELALSRYSIRGVSTAASSPTVGIYLDDISLVTVNSAFSGAIDAQLFDLDRIEVLEGPQGTLYGGSAMGGAIKYVTRRPLLDSVSITAATNVATVEHGGISYGVESTFNLPIIAEHLAIRFGASYRLDAGYVDNIAGGLTQDWSRSTGASSMPFRPLEYSSASAFGASNFNSRSTTVSRVSLEYDPLTTLTIRPVATIQRSDQPNPDEYFTNLPTFESADRFGQPTREDLSIYSLEIAERTQSLAITSLTGEVDRHLVLDRDFSLYLGALIPPLFADDSYNVSDTTTNTFSQELRVSSSTGSQIQWVLGLYYSHQRDDFLQRIDTSGAGSILGTGSDVTYLGDQLIYTTQKAVFADIDYPMGHWDVGVGARRFRIDQRVDGRTEGVLNGGTSVIAGRRSTDEGTTPRLAIGYRPTDADHLLYASAGNGFRPGGPNLYDTTSSLCTPDLRRLGLTRIPETFQSDSLWTYEVGSKNALDAGRGFVNVSAFYTRWTKIQQQVTLPTCAFPFTGNVGAARIEGAELSLETHLVRDLSVGASLTFVDSRVTGSAPGVPAQVGEELLDTPRWSGNIGTRYRVSLDERTSAMLSVDFECRGANLRQFSSVAPVTYANGVTGEIPDETEVQQAYRVVNLGLELRRDRIAYRLYVENLLDTNPYLDFRRPPGFSAADTLHPRPIGLSARASY